MPADDLPENVKRLPIRFKEQVPIERSLVFPHEVKGAERKCSHFNASFVVDETREGVECSQCGERLNPMWVLKQLASNDHRYHEARRIHREEQQRLSERKRTKCEHCGQMTRISRR